MGDQLRERFGFGDTQLKVHLARLVDLEYLVVLRNPEQSQGFIYELLYAGEGESGKRFLSGLLDTEGLKCSYEAKEIKVISVVENAQEPQKPKLIVT